MPRRRAATKGPGRHRSRPDPIALVFGSRVQQLRKELQWSFDAFVEETGLGRGYVSELERGLVVPSLHAIAKIAAALEVTIGDLVAGTTARERLFELTRGLPPAAIDDLMRQATRWRGKTAT